MNETTPLIRAEVRRAPPRIATLTRDLRRELRRGHPWVFADAVCLPEGTAAGEIVAVAGKDRRVIGLGYADPDGVLTVRMLTSDAGNALDPTLDLRFDAALGLRAALFDDAEIDGQRLVNGEGDGLPGLVIDRYADVFVIKTDGPIAEHVWHVEAIAQRLAERFRARSIYLRARSRGGAEGRLIAGAEPGITTFREGPARLAVDVASGQKTGMFLDQREHRIRVGRLARERRVLNVFGYTGGFSVHAGLGGARHVTTVDLAAPAIAQADDNWRRNGLPAERHAGVVGDAFAMLEGTAERWDLVVLDPPAFAPSKKAVPQALAAYQRLATLGARAAAPDGILFFASCSAHVSQRDLLGAIEEGIAGARRRADVIALGGQPPDHPWPLVCPELAYLKAVFLRLRG